MLIIGETLEILVNFAFLSVHRKHFYKYLGPSCDFTPVWSHYKRMQSFDSDRTWKKMWEKDGESSHSKDEPSLKTQQCNYKLVQISGQIEMTFMEFVVYFWGRETNKMGSICRVRFGTAWTHLLKTSRVHCKQNLLNIWNFVYWLILMALLTYYHYQISWICPI